MVKIADRILFYVVLKPLSYLPLGLLYFFSNIVYFLAFNFVRYRRKVVRINLENAFPEKSAQELNQIEKDFYKHFIDFIFESIKAVSISSEEVLKRTSIKNPELLDQLYDEDKNVIITCGHYNNWEFYSLSLPKLTKYTTYSIYQPLKNKFYDQILFNSRTRNGMHLIGTKDIIPFFTSSTNEKKMVIIVNDQSPSNLNSAHWNTFLNQETGWNNGPEKLARKYGYTVLFGHSRKVKRGYYEVEFTHISDNPNQLAPGEVTDIYASLLEDLIRKKPQFWLWSHKRWKHKQPSVNK
ncbi:lipid A biosynthesis acyltransferase [Crocinitomix sp.]|nr:lipid A biosynthesis acyltransferase [Crocinitomix sp.]